MEIKVLNSNVDFDKDNGIVCVDELIKWVTDCGSNDVCTQACDGVCKPWVR